MRWWVDGFLSGMIFMGFVGVRLSLELGVAVHVVMFGVEQNVMGRGVTMKKYKLLAADGTTVISETPGTLGGNAKAGIYGRLDCSAANAALSKGYADHRVFFAIEEDAISAGYRPCGRCMISQYKEWKSGPDGKADYPWKTLPC